MATDTAWPALVGLISLLICVYCAQQLTPLVRAVRIDNQFVTLAGACEEFLASLPIGSAPPKATLAEMSAAAKALSARLRPRAS